MVVFEDNTGVVQMFLCAENESIMELPSAEHLMAAYYVFGVGYPRLCRPSLLFLQEYVMGIKESAKSLLGIQHNNMLIAWTFRRNDRIAFVLMSYY